MKHNKTHIHTNKTKQTNLQKNPNKPTPQMLSIKVFPAMEYLKPSVSFLFLICVIEEVLTFLSHNTEVMSIQELFILIRKCYSEDYFSLSSSAYFLHTGMQILSIKERNLSLLLQANHRVLKGLN